MAVLKDLTGKRFNRFLVLRRVENKISPKGQSTTMWLCKCDCGIETKVTGSGLKSGQSKSCGCFVKDFPINYKHGYAYSNKKKPEYKTWAGMTQRCLNTRDKRYKDYGGRGIKVCNEWQGKDGFSNFLSDMGTKPTLSHSLDRIDNDKDYTKENCKWSTPKEQANNRRSNRILEYSGETKTATEWANLFNIRPTLIIQWLKYKWSVDKIFNKLINKYGDKCLG